MRPPNKYAGKAASPARQSGGHWEAATVRLFGLAKKAMRHKVIATRLAAEGLPLPVPLDAVVRNLRPMPLALDTGTAWRCGLPLAAMLTTRSRL